MHLPIMIYADVEFYVMPRGIDDVFSNYVQQLTSYTFDEILIKRNLLRCIAKVMTANQPSWNFIN